MNCIHAVGLVPLYGGRAVEVWLLGPTKANPIHTPRDAVLQRASAPQDVNTPCGGGHKSSPWGEGGVLRCCRSRDGTLKIEHFACSVRSWGRPAPTGLALVDDGAARQSVAGGTVLRIGRSRVRGWADGAGGSATLRPSWPRPRPGRAVPCGGRCTWQTDPSPRGRRRGEEGGRRDGRAQLRKCAADPLRRPVELHEGVGELVDERPSQAERYREHQKARGLISPTCAFQPGMGRCWILESPFCAMDAAVVPVASDHCFVSASGALEIPFR